MPDKYIVNMTEKTAPDDTNLLVIEDAADTKKITFANLFKPIKDMIGNLASLTTSHKSTLVGAVNEVDANRSIFVVASLTSEVGKSYIVTDVPYPPGFTASNCRAMAMTTSTINGKVTVPYQLGMMSSNVQIGFQTIDGVNYTAVTTIPIVVLFAKI